MRRSVVVFSLTAAAATTQICALTRKKIIDWDSHNNSFDMRLFKLIKDRLTSPTEPLPANQVYATIANPCRLIDEFTHAKTTRRLARLRTSLGFLRRHNVLLHSLLFYVKESKTWNTTGEFGRLALFGETLLKHEIRTRTLRLFPSIDSATYTSLTTMMTSEDALCRLFDQLLMKSLVGAKPEGKENAWSLTKQQKSNMLCAIVAEMNWFAARTKATDRTHNNALFPPSDALILHVLCCHVLESFPAELIYAIVEPRIHRIKEVWVNEPMSIPSQLHLKPRTIGAHALSLVRNSISDAERKRKEEAKTANLCQPSLSPDPIVGSIRSTMNPRWDYKRFDEGRYQVLEKDKRCCLSLQSSPNVKSVSDSVSFCLTDERRRELVSKAFENRN
ncbi:putative RNA editing complex protein MP46 [Trypanosoma theileri]|uniref:Putative RNA editing complex protein MP46 n=1 Tax=Trypanosoma theileri TaxID=67003 RepID=A0A1X0P3V7_9TRYP|nr:putative RNA editing complex protein MP46 [Trypanosoma theileri]ORC91614.1 putative RNA editing complex protein MP46 [Trypanosoma theileri]